MSQTTLASLRADTRGASFMEYVVLVGLIAIVCIAAYQAFGSAIGDKVEEFGNTVTGIPGG
jgi:pilus assembly protein Flp/PilA